MDDRAQKGELCFPVVVIEIQINKPRLRLPSCLIAFPNTRPSFIMLEKVHVQQTSSFGRPLFTHSAHYLFNWKMALFRQCVKFQPNSQLINQPTNQPNAQLTN